MKSILLFGAGKSATDLIEYLIKESAENGWRLTVCDANLSLAQSKIGNTQYAEAVSVDVKNDLKRIELINAADIVISMLPPALHFLIAKDCIACNKNLLTASYVDDNIRSLQNELEGRGLLFLCEMGLDPGIDHMSAMRMIDSIKEQGGKITSFLSHCGGLIAPESDNNPWHYKITWNPRNIVLAGKDGAEYRKDNLPDVYPLCWYPNRDSLDYIDVYGLHDISTFVRTTLRHPAFCNGWDVFVNIGLTQIDDYDQIKDCTTSAEWFTIKSSLLNENEKKWSNKFSEQMDFLGLKSEEILPADFLCSADILQHVMEKKLAMQASDKDMIVMFHELEYEFKNEKYKLQSSLIVKGENRLSTAMSKTVGLPLGIATKLILQNKIALKGLHIPLSKEIYEPVLKELEMNGIIFNEQSEKVN